VRRRQRYAQLFGERLRRDLEAAEVNQGLLAKLSRGRQSAGGGDGGGRIASGRRHRYGDNAGGEMDYEPSEGSEHSDALADLIRFGKSGALEHLSNIEGEGGENSFHGEDFYLPEAPSGMGFNANVDYTDNVDEGEGNRGRLKEGEDESEWLQERRRRSDSGVGGGGGGREEHDVMASDEALNFLPHPPTHTPLLPAPPSHETGAEEGQGEVEQQEGFQGEGQHDLEDHTTDERFSFDLPEPPTQTPLSPPPPAATPGRAAPEQDAPLPPVWHHQPVEEARSPRNIDDMNARGKNARGSAGEGANNGWPDGNTTNDEGAFGGLSGPAEVGI
jgi:hypothetical protein